MVGRRVPQNTRALNFWRKVVAEYTHGQFREVVKTSEQLKTAEHSDPYPMIILRFKISPDNSNGQPIHGLILREPRLEDETAFLAIEIRQLKEADISVIVNAFDQIGWNKPTTLFQKYLKEQNERYVWVAYQQNQFVGYITLKVGSEYLPFAKKNIPEIKDLNVLPSYRNQGIGSALMKRQRRKQVFIAHKLGSAWG